MIKPGKVCSQLGNNTGETDIKVVKKYFRLTIVFNALKNSLNLCLSSSIPLSLFLIFEIRGVLSLKTCLEGGNLVRQIMHAPWCITGCSSNNFHQSHMQRTSMGGQQALFCGKIMEACEAKEHGHDLKQRHQVEGPIMQAKEWMREFGRCNLWSTWAQKSQSEDDHTRGKPSQGGHEATQAGRPRTAGLTYLSTPQCSSSAGKQLIQLSVCVLEFVV
jgi:hypothetical protein